MQVNQLKSKNYSIIIGESSITRLASEVKYHCPKCKRVAIVIDKKIPKKFIIRIKKNLKKYKVFIFFVTSSEKI